MKLENAEFEHEKVNAFRRVMTRLSFVFLVVLLSFQAVWSRLDTEKDPIAILDEAVVDGDVLRLLKQQAEEHEERIKKLHDEIEVGLGALNAHLQTLTKQMKESELAVEERVKAFEEVSNSHVEDYGQVVDDATGGRSSWLFPFIFVAGGVVVVSGIGYGKYRKIVKSHLL